MECTGRAIPPPEIRKCTHQGGATIGGKGHQPSGIGTVCWIWRDDSGKSHEYARPKYSHDCFRNVWIKQKYIKKKWDIRTQRFNCIMKKILQFSSHTFGYYPHFLSDIFGAYSFSLFGFSVIYFLSVIVGYKLGFVRGPTYCKYCPRRRGSEKIFLKKYQIQQVQA